MNTIVLATRSAGKLRELRLLFAASRLGGREVIDLAEAGVPESPEEDGLEVFETFEANALAKARHFHALTGMATVADDSGLAVSALGGRPGVLSKRWSGRSDLSGQALDDENNRLLLERMAETGSADRGAHYVCVAAYVDGVQEIVCRGEVHGRVLEEARGTGGFGYDPYFAPKELGGRSFGEASQEEKQGVSHRARAFGSLLERLAAIA
jgi:XTP/dITP diphosphohydrolase